MYESNLWGGFWFVHILYGSMIKIKSLAQFPMDQLTHSVVSSLYSFCANLLHFLNLWLTVSSLSSHNLHLLFWVFFYAATTKDSVSLFTFPFRCNIHVFSCAISLLCPLKYPYCFSYHFYCFFCCFFCL